MEKEGIRQNKYSTSKDTGIEWLGRIPSHWILKKVKYLWDEKKSLAMTEGDTLLSVSQYRGVCINKEESRGNSQIGYNKVNENDLVINIMLAWLGGLGLSAFSGVVSPSYAVYELTYNANTKFLHYLYRTKIYLAEFARKSTGVVPSRWRMYSDDFGQVLTVLPPVKEQTAIANFLDKKTAKIDQAIAQKERLIELLKERKQIVIQNAVTKGLDPDVEMKDSGVEWIGEIPAHWEVKKVKHVANVILGKMICNQNLGSMELKPYLKSKNIQWLKVDVSSVDEMWFTKQEMEQYRLKKDDLVLSEGGEVGKTCIWNNEIPECYIQNSAHKVTLNSDSNPFFYLYLFNHIGKQGGFDSTINRVSIGHLTKDKLLNVVVVKPPIQEQSIIVAHIETQSAKIDQAISLQQTQIEKLKEYKATLIDSAVTGKIKVT